MSKEQILAAAAALRQFSLDEIAAFCDEQPLRIIEVLESVEGRELARWP